MTPELDPIALEEAKKAVRRFIETHFEQEASDFMCAKTAHDILTPYLASLKQRGVRPTEPASSADFHQRRGVAFDIVDEAITTYHEFMLDDDFDAMHTLRKIMDRMIERRDAFTPQPVQPE